MPRPSNPPQVSTHAGLGQKLLLAVGFPVGVLLALELACRVGGVLPARVQRPFKNFSLGWSWTAQPEPLVFRTQPTRFYEPKPNRRGVARTDEHGFRGPDHPQRHARLVRIAVLGDSTTFGFGVNYGDTFCARTESELRRIERQEGRVADIDVIDAGCYGYSSYQNRVDLEERVLPLAPDVVVFCLPGFNDSVGALGFDDESWGKLAPRSDGGLLTRFLDDSRLASGLKKLLAPLEEKRLLGDVGKAQEQVLRGDVTQGRRVPVEAFESNVRSMIATTRAHGATPIVMIHPFPADQVTEDPYRGKYAAAMRTIAAQTHATLADGPARLDSSDATNYYDKIHPTEQGHARLAEVLVAALRSDATCTKILTERGTVAVTPPCLESRAAARVEASGGARFEIEGDFGNDPSPRFSLGGNPLEIVALTNERATVETPPLPVGSLDLTVATRSGSAVLERAAEVVGPRLSVSIAEGRATVRVASLRDSKRFTVHVATAAREKPMMLRRVFGLDEKAALGKPLEATLSASTNPSDPLLPLEGVLEIPLPPGQAIPHLFLQALVEPDADACAKEDRLAIALPTNVVEVGGK